MSQGHTTGAVALKQLKVPGLGDDSDALVALKHEFEILKRCEHRNIIKLYGAVLEESIALLIEYAARGSLRDALDEGAKKARR